VRFWDSSALVPLVLEEPASVACRRALRADPVTAVWALTRTEVVSAIRRLERAGDLDAAGVATALGRIEARAARWTEVDALEPVRQRAERLLAVHPLRAADALQLGAALALFDDRPRGQFFLTRDTDLAGAAGREGFSVIVPT
jgi:predicted nucleic acid-binding protein